MSELVTYEIADNIATITMDDGKANVLSTPMFEALNAAFDKAEEAEAIVLFKGRKGFFSGGFDLAEMGQGPKPAVALVALGSTLARRILSFPTPVIGVSTGHCMAMGAFLMLACDYRIGTDGPFKIGLNETLIGMKMHSFGIELGRYRLPQAYFNRCVINAEIFTPTDAIIAGYYDRVAPSDQLDGAATMAGQMFSQLKMHAFKATKINSRKEILALLEACISADLNLKVDF